MKYFDPCMPSEAGRSKMPQVREVARATRRKIELHTELKV